MRSFVLIIPIFILSGSLCAQQDSLASTDSARVSRKQIYAGPRKASILSAILPGAGQVYNRSYWKVPIIYAGLGGLGYMFYINHADFKYFSTNLAAIYDDESAGTVNVTPYTAQQLIELKQASRRMRDFSGLGIILLYLVNIVDANVDAHLKTFDVSDDLSFQLKPYGNFLFHDRQRAMAGGITLKIKFN